MPSDPTNAAPEVAACPAWRRSGRKRTRVSPRPRARLLRAPSASRASGRSAPGARRLAALAALGRRSTSLDVHGARREASRKALPAYVNRARSLSAYVDSESPGIRFPAPPLDFIRAFVFGPHGVHTRRSDSERGHALRHRERASSVVQHDDVVQTLPAERAGFSRKWARRGRHSTRMTRRAATGCPPGSRAAWER